MKTVLDHNSGKLFFFDARQLEIWTYTGYLIFVILIIFRCDKVLLIFFRYGVWLYSKWWSYLLEITSEIFKGEIIWYLGCAKNNMEWLYGWNKISHEFVIAEAGYVGICYTMLFHLLSYMIEILCHKIFKIPVYTDRPISMDYHRVLPYLSHSVFISFFSHTENSRSQPCSYLLSECKDEKNLDL